MLVDSNSMQNVLNKNVFSQPDQLRNDVLKYWKWAEELKKYHWWNSGRAPW
jgi:hypothetical protein